MQFCVSFVSFTAVKEFVTCMRSQSKQRKAQTQFLDLAATSLLAQPRKIRADYKAQMLEPSERAVLS